MKIKGIIFDMDGVLLLSSRAHSQAFHEVLSVFGIHDFNYPDYAGMRTDEVFRHVLSKAGISFNETMLRDLVNEKRDRAFDILENHPPVVSHCKMVLEKLSAVYKLGLASSSSRRNVDFFLEKSRCGDFFSSVLSGEEVSRAKPDPEIYQASLNLLGLDPKEAIVIEDALSGVQAAHTAGIRVIGIAGTTEANTLKQGGVYMVLEKLEDLVGVL